jgi:hypothetical protein
MKSEDLDKLEEACPLQMEDRKGGHFHCESCGVCPGPDDGKADTYPGGFWMTYATRRRGLKEGGPSKNCAMISLCPKCMKGIFDMADMNIQHAEAIDAEDSNLGMLEKVIFGGVSDYRKESRPFREHTMVRLLEPLVTEHAILDKGDVGTIISVHSKGGQYAYTVEFLQEGKVPIIVTLDWQKITAAEPT